MEKSWKRGMQRSRQIKVGEGQTGKEVRKWIREVDVDRIIKTNRGFAAFFFFCVLFFLIMQRWMSR